MSSTTTMVRWYCEYLYNQVINDNTNPPNNWVTDVNTIIPAVWEKIFYEFPIWEESYRPTLCQKILRHYYFREIGEETVEFWKLRLQQTLGEIMPYYIQLWETTQVEYEKLWTRNYIEKYLGNENRTEDKTSNESSDYHDTATTSDTANTLTDFTDDAKTNIKQTGKTHDKGTRTYSETVKDVTSNTPMNQLTWNDLENNLYATSTDFRSTSGNENTTNDGTSENTTDQTYNDTSNTKVDSTYDRHFTDENSRDTDYTHNVKGKTNTDYIREITGWDGVNPNDLILKWRETLLNIDVMIIEELEDCFLGVYY